MDVYLVAPDALRTYGEPTHQPKKGLFPPLGLMTVAALTPPQINGSITDEALEPVDFDRDADLVGLTAMTSAAPRAYQIADRFRQRGTAVVMGGMHASALPEEALQHVDAVVIGEAEGLWLGLPHLGAAGLALNDSLRVRIEVVAGLQVRRHQQDELGVLVVR